MRRFLDLVVWEVFQVLAADTHVWGVTPARITVIEGRHDERRAS